MRVDRILRDLPITAVEAANYTDAKRRRPDIDLVVEHMAITPELATSAEGVANYFTNPNVRASAHLTADNNSIVQSVLLEDVAWAAPGANHDGIQIEHAGRQSQTAKQFRDRYSTAMFKLSARAQARIAIAYDIPIVWLTVSDLRAGRRGFTSHDNVSKAFGRSNHYDGRAPFPNWWLLGLIRKEVARLGKRDPTTTKNPFRKTPPTLKLGTDAPEWRTKQAQRFLNAARETHGNKPIPANGRFTKTTRRAVRTFQKAHGLTVDGAVGPQTWKLLWQHKELGHEWGA